MKNLPQSSFLAGKITKSVRIETIITKTKIQANIFGTFRATDSNDNTIVKADHKKNAMETIANERFRVRYAEYCLRHKW